MKWRIVRHFIWVFTVCKDTKMQRVNERIWLSLLAAFWLFVSSEPFSLFHHSHTGQCKRTGGCYNELVVAFLRTGDGLKGKIIYSCWLHDLFISLYLFYLWWHLAHRPTVTLQFMALPSNWWFNSWFGRQIQHSSGVLPWQVLFSSITA